MNPSTIAAVPPPLSRLERVKLSIHRALDRHLGPLGVWVMRRSKGGVTKAWKVNAFVLTTRGRKSGRERTVVLQYFPDGGAMVVVAANDGGAAHPGWYFNLMTSPDAVVEVDGRRIPVTASELGPDEAAHGAKHRQQGGRRQLAVMSNDSAASARRRSSACMISIHPHARRSRPSRSAISTRPREDLMSPSALNC